MDESAAGRRGPTEHVRAVTEELYERLQSLAEAARRAGTGAVGELTGPLPAAAGEMLQSMRNVLESVPAPTVPLDMLMEEVRAKRAIVRAMQEQLTSFDTQLELFERSLVPLHEWSKQWESMQARIMDPLLRGKRD